MQIVKRYKAQAKYLLGLDQMAQVAASKLATGGTRTAFFDRALLQGELGVLQVERAVGGKGGAVARQASREDAIKHVDAAGDQLEQLRWRAEAHRVARLVVRQKRLAPFHRLHHFRFRLAYAHPADCIAIETDLNRRLRARPAQIFESAALHDAEEELTLRPT